MNPRQARRERREAERKAKKLELKKSRLAENHPLPAAEHFPKGDEQPGCARSSKNEFPREMQIPDSPLAHGQALRAALQIPLPDPTPLQFTSLEQLREHYSARKKVASVDAEPQDISFVSQTSPLSPKRAAINRANAQLSTGPRSSTGKLASSRNSTKHGLASGTVIIPGEDQAHFESLLVDLSDDLQPTGTAEALLVQEMAQSHWLAQRALRLQNDCFTESGVDQKSLALFLRYGTAHHRAFHKALTELQRLQKDRRKQELGFVSQTAAATAAAAGFVSQNEPSPPQKQEFIRQNSPSVDLQLGFVLQTTPDTYAERTQSSQEAA